MASRNTYRIWHDAEEGEQVYMLIHPSGLMLEIRINTDDDYNESIKVCQTNHRNIFDPARYRKAGFKATKAEFDVAVRRAHDMANGQILKLMLEGKSIPKIPE